MTYEEKVTKIKRYKLLLSECDYQQRYYYNLRDYKGVDYWRKRREYAYNKINQLRFKYWIFI